MIKRQTLVLLKEELLKRYQLLSPDDPNAKKLVLQLQEVQNILSFEVVENDRSEVKQYSYQQYLQALNHQLQQLFLKYHAEVVYQKEERKTKRKHFQDYLDYMQKRLTQKIILDEEGIRWEASRWIDDLTLAFDQLNDLSIQLEDFIKTYLPKWKDKYTKTLQSDPKSNFAPQLLFTADRAGLIKYLAHYKAFFVFQIPYPEETSPEHPSKGYTLAQQYFAIYYMLVALDLNFEEVPKTDIARFVQLLTNREIGKTIIRGNIYKRVKNPFSKNNRHLMSDLKVILPYFRQLQLGEIVRLIERDLNSFSDK